MQPGLAAGPMGGFETASLDAEFFPSGDWRSFLVVNIGYSGQNPWYQLSGPAPFGLLVRGRCPYRHHAADEAERQGWPLAGVD